MVKILLYPIDTFTMDGDDMRLCPKDHAVLLMAIDKFHVMTLHISDQLHDPCVCCLIM